MSIEVRGFDVLRRRIRALRAVLAGDEGDILVTAIGECVDAVKTAAQAILTKEVYEKERAAYEKVPKPDDEDSLMQSFVSDFNRAVRGSFRAALGNTAPEAVWVEFGTDDAGEGTHNIQPVNADALHWIDKYTGESRFFSSFGEDDPHIVSGQHPVRFMQRALRDSQPIIKQIMADAVKRAVVSALRA